jgi:hypothetical protein
MMLAGTLHFTRITRDLVCYILVEGSDHRTYLLPAPGVDFTLQLTFSILGLIGTRTTSATVTGAACPVELSINAA